jgi:hypothetical protein
VHEHPVLEFGVTTKENGHVNAVALFKNGNSTIIVYDDEKGNYAEYSFKDNTFINI